MNTKKLAVIAAPTNPSLDRDGYYLLEKSNEIEKVSQAAAIAFERFCTQSLSEKQKFLRNDLGGYEIRDMGKTLRDLQETFEFSTQFDFSHMALTEIDQDFIDKATALLKCALVPARAFLQEVASVCSVYEKAGLAPTFANNCMEHTHCWSLRFVHHLPGKNQLLCSPYVGVRAFTGVLYTSSWGYQNLSLSAGLKWQEILPASKKILFFPDLVMHYLSHGVLKALSRRVVATPETRKNGHYAIELVGDSPFVSLKQAQFGRMPADFTWGSHYALSHRDFSHYFIVTTQDAV